MADIKINGATPSGFYYGGTAASAVYYGSTKLWESAPAPDPDNTLFYNLGSETIKSNSAKIIDLRAAGLPTTSERPYIAFYNEVWYSGSKSAAGNEISYSSSSDTPLFGLVYQKNPNSSSTTSYPFYVANGSQTGGYSTVGSCKRLKTIFAFSTYTNKWYYQMYQSSNGSSWTYAGSNSYSIDNTPFDIRYLFTPGTSTNGWMTFADIKCVGFTDENVAKSWNGSWPISQ